MGEALQGKGDLEKRHILSQIVLMETAERTQEVAQARPKTFSRIDVNRALAIARVIACKFVIRMGDRGMCMGRIIQRIVDRVRIGEEPILVVHVGFDEGHDSSLSGIRCHEEPNVL